MRDDQAQIADEGSARRGALQDLLGRLPLAADRPWIGYGFAIALSALAALARQEADPFLPPGFPFLTFFPSVFLMRPWHDNSIDEGKREDLKDKFFAAVSIVQCKAHEVA